MIWIKRLSSLDTPRLVVSWSMFAHMVEPMNLFCCVHAHASLANHKLFVKCDDSIGPLNSVVTIRCDLSKVEIALRRMDAQSH